MPSLRSVLASLFLLAIVAGPALAQSGSFGNAIVVGDDEMIIAEPNNTFRSGIVYVYHKTGTAWRETAQLTAPDAERADGFGAALVTNGNTLFVAQRGGRIHTFDRDGMTWRFSGTLADGGRTGLDPVCNSYGYCGSEFGITLATEGDWLLVGEPGTRIGVARGRRRRGGGEPPAVPVGVVHAFHREADGRWTQQQTLESPESASGDAFGAVIAMLDGRALIGSPKATWTPSAPTEGARGNAGRRGARASEPPAAIREAGRVFEFRLENGAWQQGEEMTTRAEAEAGFGTAIAFEGDVAVIGAPGSGGGYGGAYLFTRDAVTGVWSERSRLAAFNGNRGDRFGSAVSVDGDDIWVGAPVSRGIETGMAFVFSGTDQSFEDAPRRIRFTEMETNAEDGFGHRVVSNGGVAAVAASGVDHQAGAVFVYERNANGQWQDRGVLVSPPDALAQVSGEERRCTDGAADQFDCEDIELLAFVPIGTLRAPGDSRGVRTNDNWGWTDSQTGREYALVGRNDGTSFIDITDPVNPVLVGDLPKTPNTPRSQLWRDIKTYRNHAYIVADGAGEHGMQVFDLTRLRDVADPPAMFEPDLLYRGEGQHVVESTHNIMINEESGYAYLTSRECSGMHIVDIREPLDPKFVSCADPGGTHDAQCLNYQGPDDRYRGREICLRMSGSRFQISDVTDKANPRELAQASHPNPTYMHQGWVTPDHNYFFMDDESDVISGNVETTRTLIWDISDLEDPQLAREFMGSMPASAHNLYVNGDFTYQANYRYGLHILDTSDPLNPREVGSFDTSPYQTGPGFSGAWSTYPFFESGTILVTSLQEGLFILKKRTKPVS